MTMPDVSYSTGAALGAELAQLQAQLQDLARSMVLANQTGQAQALEQFRAQYRNIAAQLAALRIKASQADMPSAFIIALDKVSDDAIAAGKRLGADVSDTLHTGVTLVKLLPWLIVGALVIIGVAVYKGALKVKL